MIDSRGHGLEENVGGDLGARACPIKGTHRQWRVQFTSEESELTDLVREYVLVIEKPLRPIHQRIDIVRCRELRWPAILDAVFPEVLVPERVGVGL